jgi:sodium transport system permease protein
MTLGNALIVYRKELVDSLRDRRTVISMVVIPIIMFPLLTVGMGYLTMTFLGKARQEVPQVMILGGEDSPQLMAKLGQFKGIEIVPARPDYVDEISNKAIRAAVQVPSGFDAALDLGGPAHVTIFNYEGEIKSEFASESLERFFDDVRDQTAKAALAAHHLPASLLEPVTVEKKNVAPPEKVGGAALGGFVPYFVIILCLTGAMYPAMDLTAGEKERGTMETILCSPVSRTDLVMGKFLMVVTASLTTAILAITSMALSFSYAKNFVPGMATGADSPFHVTIGLKGVFAVFAMVLPLSVLFSGVLLAISLFAKSFREAQSYVSPLTFVVIMPAIASLLPGIELNAKTALIPILSTSLVSKEIVSATYHWGYIALIFVTSCIYASAAIAYAVHLFNREDVLFRA